MSLLIIAACTAYSIPLSSCQSSSWSIASSDPAIPTPLSSLNTRAISSNSKMSSACNNQHRMSHMPTLLFTHVAVNNLLIQQTTVHKAAGLDHVSLNIALSSFPSKTHCRHGHLRCTKRAAQFRSSRYMLLKQSESFKRMKGIIRLLTLLVTVHPFQLGFQ
jgi:hypothetical protein